MPENPVQNIKNELLQTKLPNVQIFEDIKQRSKVRSLISQWVFSFRVVYVILILIIIVELGIGIKTLVEPFPQVNKLQPISDGKIILTAEKSSFNVGEEIPVEIKISTGGHTVVGVDIVLQYDPKKFSSAEVEKGNIFDDYPGVDIDTKNGVILISGAINSDAGGFNGTSEFATVNLKAKEKGQTTLSLDYKSGITTDSNIIESASSKDVLGEVYNLNLDIGGLGSQKLASSESCQGFTQICWDDEGKQGTQECEGGAKVKDMCIWDPNLTVSCGYCETSK